MPPRTVRRAERSRPLRRLALVAGLAGAAAAGGGIANLVLDDPPPRRGSRVGSEVLGPGPEVRVTRAPASYRIVYRVDELKGNEALSGTDRLFVRRPFDSRLETWDGLPPGTEQRSVQVGILGSRSATIEGEKGEAVGVAPGVPASDVRIDAETVEAAMDAGLMQRRERRRVAGRVCQVYRSGSALLGRLQPPTASRHVDTCIDGAGLALEELHVTEGTGVLRRVAVEVEENAPLANRLFTTLDPTANTRETGLIARPVEAGAPLPAGWWTLGSPPRGFVEKGRFAIEPRTTGGQVGTASSISQVWARGPDLLVLDQGAAPAGRSPFPNDPADAAAIPRDFGALGKGELLLGGQGHEARVVTADGHFVRVVATLPPEDLVDVMTSLQPPTP